VPIAILNILEGRSVEKKRRLIENVSQAMADALEMPIDRVRVLVQEYPYDAWGRGGKTVADRIDDGSAMPPKP
jgi:4-oxalocrotonate tautomerase